MGFWRGVGAYDGDKLDDDALPDGMNIQEVRQAMSTIKSFPEKERNYHMYQARQNYIRIQNTIRLDFERKMEQAQQEKEAALQEVERLKALLGK